MTDFRTPEGDLTAAEPEELLLMCGHAPGPEPLSPAAQAVLEALYMDELNGGEQLMARSHAAAALRAAADQVAPECYNPPRGVSYPEKEAFIDGKCVRNEDIRYAILAIADELEGANAN